MTERVVIALATNLLTRGALIATPGRTSRDGAPAHVRFAIARAVLQAVSFKAPEYALAVFDADADAAALSPALAAELERLPALFEGLGFQCVLVSRPADVVAAYSRAALAARCDVVVVGSDKRLAQLVQDRVWWYDAYKDVRYTAELVRKRFDVGPELVSDWLAMVGDEDTLPGVKGLGKKSATQLMTEYGSIEAALAAADAIEGRTGKALRAAEADARRELARARLDQSAPLPQPLSELRFEEPEPTALQALYGELGFLELLRAEEHKNEVQICCDDAALTVLLAGFDGAPVSVYALAEEPSLVRGELAGVALVQVGQARAGYVPLRGKGQLAAAVPAALAELLGGDRPKIAHDLAALHAAFLRHGIVLSGFVSDSACASHLHQPSGLAPHDVNVLAPAILQRAVPELDSVLGVGRARKAWAQIAVELAAQYAVALARASGEIVDKLAPTTDRALLDEYLALSEALGRMAHHGICCDADNLARAGADFERIGAELEAQIHELAGHSFNVNSTKQLGEVLFEELKLPVAS